MEAGKHTLYLVLQADAAYIQLGASLARALGIRPLELEHIGVIGLVVCLLYELAWLHA